jgi:hypothetical protein
MAGSRSTPPGSGSPDQPDAAPDGDANFKWKGVETAIVRKQTGLASNRQDKPERRKKIQLGQMLIEAGLLTNDQLEMGLADQRRTRGLIGEALISLGFVGEKDVA